jgi:hypothetical protein
MHFDYYLSMKVTEARYLIVYGKRRKIHSDYFIKDTVPFSGL